MKPINPQPGPTKPKEYYDDILYNYRAAMQKRYDEALAKYNKLVEDADKENEKRKPAQGKVFDPDAKKFTSSFSLATMGLKGLTISASGATVSGTVVCETARGVKCGAWGIYAAPSVSTMVTALTSEQARAVLATVHAQMYALSGMRGEAADVLTTLSGFAGYFI